MNNLEDNRPRAWTFSETDSDRIHRNQKSKKIIFKSFKIDESSLKYPGPLCVVWVVTLLMFEVPWEQIQIEWYKFLQEKVKVPQSCPTLCNPMDFRVHGILHARILEWIGLPSPGHLPNPGIEPRSPTLQEYSLLAEPQGKPKRKRRGFIF